MAGTPSAESHSNQFIQDVPDEVAESLLLQQRHDPDWQESLLDAWVRINEDAPQVADFIRISSLELGRDDPARRQAAARAMIALVMLSEATKQHELLANSWYTEPDLTQIPAAELVTNASDDVA